MRSITNNKGLMTASVAWVILAALLMPMLATSRWSQLIEFGKVGRWVGLVLLGSVPLIVSARNLALPRRVMTVDIIAVIFLSVALLSSLYSLNPRTTILRTLSVVLMYGAVFWGIWIYADARGPESVVRVIIIVAAFAMCLHLIVALVDPVGSFPYQGRFRGWAHNPGTLGTQVSLLLPLVLWKIMERPRWQLWVLIGLMLLSLIVSQSRSELVAAEVAVLYFLFRARPHHKRQALLGGGAVFMACVGWLYIGSRVSLLDQQPKVVPSADSSVVISKPESSQGSSNVDVAPKDQVVSTGSSSTDVDLMDRSVNTESSGADISHEDSPVSTGSRELEITVDQGAKETKPWYRQPSGRNLHILTLSHRTTKWALGMEFLAERLLLGFGFGTEDQLFQSQRVDPNLYFYSGWYIHNSYLGLAVQLGLTGFALFYVPLGLLVCREVKYGASVQQPLLRSAILAVVLGSLVSAVMTSWLYSMGNESALLFWICVMLLVRFRTVDETNSP